MKTTRVLWICLWLAAAFSACKNGGKSNGKLHITATTGMIADMAEQIGGQYVEVQALMGPGVDPHLYKPTQGDLSRLADADIVFHNGLHLEGKMTEVLQKMSKKQAVYAVSDTLSENQLLRVPGSSFPDPHIWHDASLWKQCMWYMAGKMAASDPPHAQEYMKNAALLAASLDSLHEEVKSQMASIPEEKRILVTSHDAFEYYGKAYGVKVRGLQGISTVAEPGIRDINDLVNFIVDRKIKTVFVESSVSPRLMESVTEGCRNKGWNVNSGITLYSDALGQKGTPEGTYTGMLRYNSMQISRGLQ